MRRLLLLLDSLRLHSLCENMADAGGPLPRAVWARGIDVQFAPLGMASSFIAFGLGALGSHSFMHMAGMAEGQCWLTANPAQWDGPHVSLGHVP